jgi:outer membrane lipoprotein-sorting protein
MKKIFLLTTAVFAFSPMGNALTPIEIMQKNYSVSKVKDSTTEITIRLINSSGQERVRKSLAKTKLIKGTSDEMRYVKFLSPTDIKGTSTLLNQNTGKDDDMWIYLPALKKVRRLIANNKRDSFVGTDFSYGDVMGFKVEEWNYKLLKEENKNTRPCYVIESIPKNKETIDNTGYSKRILWIDKENFVGLATDGYDGSGQILKKSLATEIKLVDSANKKYVAMKLEAENVQSNHKTVITFENYKANVGVGDEYFKARSLEK